MENRVKIFSYLGKVSGSIKNQENSLSNTDRLYFTLRNWINTDTQKQNKTNKSKTPKNTQVHRYVGETMSGGSNVIVEWCKFFINRDFNEIHCTGGFFEKNYNKD